MRGSIKERSKGSWLITLEFGYIRDPESGRRTRVQKFETFHGTKKKAQDRLNDLISEARRGEYIEPSKLTLGEWLREWLDASLKPGWRPSTYARYKGIIEASILKSTVAAIPLQHLRPTHIEAYYSDATVSASTLTLHHAILHRALRKAVKDRLIQTNVAHDLDRTPRRNHDEEFAQLQAWTAEEARKFLAAAKAAGPQKAAFYALALDSGARKGELCALRWSNLDLDAGTVRIGQTLLTPGAEPKFGPPKNGKARTISLASETLEVLRAHKRHQAQLKMANRTTYKDFGLVFAKEWNDLRGGERIGQPLPINNMGQREYARLIRAAGVRPIRFHGMRHTTASLLLQAGQPVHVVSERLGHKRVEVTLEIYAHVLPGQQAEAARRIGTLLYGK
jgi:integrase